MVKIVEGNLISKGKKFGVIASRFNDFMTKDLVSGCLDTLTRHGAQDADLTVVWVPGAFEIPFIAKKMADSKKYDAIITLGAVIRGNTPHFDYVAGEVSKGVAQVGLNSSIPVIFGVLTVDSIEQAIERAGTKSGNKGSEAAKTAIEMVNLISSIDKK